MKSKGIESSLFYLILAAFILLTTAMIVFPAHSDWQETMDRGRAITETERILYGIESVYSLGDIGSTEQVRIDLPRGYEIDVENSSICLKKEGQVIHNYSVTMNLNYIGTKKIEGPGKFNITLVYWIKNDTQNTGKEFLIEVLDK